jgi:hypothetical protein
MKPIPELNKEYHIFDDGKIRPNRHYTCKIVEIIPFNECKDNKLIKFYKKYVKEHYWLFSKETDYFIKGISSFDKNPLYFARTKDGGWFSMDYPNEWMGAELDIDGSLYKILVKDYGGKEL